MKNFTHKFIGILALVFTMSFTVNAQGPPPPDGGGGVEDYGCTDASADNYDELVTVDDGSCTYTILGCTDPMYLEFDASANLDDESCVTLVVEGCTDATAFNYDAEAHTDDGSCNALDLPQGWSMFGYTCMDSVDAMVGFSDISDKIEIVKDEWGLSYLPSWDFNAMGSLQFSEGYQIKMIEAVTGFQFCSTITPEDGIGQSDVDTAYDAGAASVTPEDGITQADVDTAYDAGAASVTPEDGITQADVDAAVAEVEASYAGWCASDIDNDGICDVDEVSGCMDASSCNYVSAAEFDDNSCEYSSCLDECGVPNGDNSTCLDCAGVVNGTSEDLGCGCGNPQAQEGYDCEGNELLQIGDEHAGGIVFQINEDGTGLVAAEEDLPEMYPWGCSGTSISGADGQAIGTGYQNTLDIVSECSETPIAASEALAYESEGYSDWYLPSKDELVEMYYTIGNGGSQGNIGGFEDDWYWSSSAYYSNLAWYVYFNDGVTNFFNKNFTVRVRVIRAF